MAIQRRQEAMATKRGDQHLLRELKGFRAEWTDGVTGRADGVVLLVRTVGFGSGRRRLETVAADDVERILFDERRIIVRAREPFRISPPGSLRRLFRRVGRT